MQKDKYFEAMYDVKRNVSVTNENREEVHNAAKCWLRKVGNVIFDDETGARVERVNMCGGDYIMFDADGDVAGLTFDVDEALKHINL